MKRYKAKKTQIPWFMTKKCILVQVIIITLLVHGLVNMVAKRSQAAHKFDIANEEYETVQDSHERLGGNVELLSTEYGKESVLRESFGVVKPNEKVYTIMEPEEYQKKLLPLKPQRTWWQEIWQGDDE